ncbi:hypothetical protein [Modestobacter excelsi]|uniref:hypothetical protein n=1 Tax=Modestobacter excelsi TaxID=2213161 RepID=UPI00110C98CC|nr:hypothetical protein [Modestobacter excelsi]
MRARAELPDVEVTEVGGHRFTTPTRTLVDTIREWSELPAVVALDAALLRGLVTPEELRGTLDRRRFRAAGLGRELASPGPATRALRAVPRAP